VIAAIQGVAAGGGWALALACDVRIAADDARFVPAVAQVGLVPALGGAGNLVKAVGYSRAMEFLLLRDEFSAGESLAFGMINKVVPPETLMHEATIWAKRIAQLPSDAVQQCKRLLRLAAHRHQSSELAEESWAQLGLVTQPEHQERVATWHKRNR